MNYDEFVKRLSASRLMTPQMLRTHLQEVPDAQRPQDAQSLARWLVKAGHLTAWQAKTLYSGRTSGLVLGNYVLQDKLGAGGMGEVYKARHLRMQRTVALKVLPEKIAHDESLIARFHREVQAAARLMHPNIVTAFDADEADGRFFLVMEYVPGRDLASIVRQRGPFPLEQALDCVLDAARGLEYAHRHGIIHRDIKPANLLLMDAGEWHKGPGATAPRSEPQRPSVKILDMGLARIDDAVADVGEQAELTGTGVVMGTVDYMAPEQAINTRSADHRSDIYSLGITLYYLLTGQPAYPGSSVMERLIGHREAPIPSLRTRRSSLPPELDDVFARMIAKRADERFQSMSDVIAALQSVRSGSHDSQAGGSTVRASSEPSDTALASFLQSIETGGGAGAASATQPTRVLSESQAEIADTLIGQSEDATRTVVQTTVPQTRRRRDATTPAWLWPSLIGGGLVAAGLFVLASLSGPEAATDAGPTDVTGVAESPTDEAVAEPSSQPFETPPEFRRATDRQIAQQIVDLGGTFDYADFFGEKAQNVRDLPDIEEIAVTGARFYGTDAIPDDLTPLLELGNLTNLIFVPRLLQPEHLQVISRMRTLNSLDLGTGEPTDIDDEDVAELLASLPNLNHFGSFNLPLDGSGLVSAPSGLRWLVLGSITNLGRAPTPPRLAPEAFAGMRKLSESFHLGLDGRALDEDQLAGLASVESLGSLSLVGADGVTEHLELLQPLSILSRLNLQKTALEDKHLDGLMQLTQLRELDVSENYLTADGVERLRQALPQCYILSDFGTFEPSGSGGAPSMAASDIAPVGELNAPDREDGYCWPSADGRTLMYLTQREGEHQIRQAVRDSEGIFQDQVPVITQRVLPAFSGDLLHMVADRNVDGVRILVEGSRPSLDEPFDELTPAETPEGELAGTSPWLSVDGLTLVYQNNNPARDYAGGPQPEAGGLTTEFLITRRPAIGQPWDPPEQLPLEDSPLLTEALTWPVLLDEGRTLLFCDSGTWRARVMVATRSSPDQPFGDVRPLLVNGQPIDARAPRYVAATRELYLTRRDDSEDWNLWRLSGGRIVDGSWVADREGE